MSLAVLLKMEKNFKVLLIEVTNENESPRITSYDGNTSVSLKIQENSEFMDTVAQRMWILISLLYFQDPMQVLSPLIQIVEKYDWQIYLITKIRWM